MQQHIYNETAQALIELIKRSIESGEKKENRERQVIFFNQIMETKLWFTNNEICLDQEFLSPSKSTIYY